MKKFLFTISTLLIAISASAQYTAESIMSALPAFPDNELLKAAASHDLRFNDQQAKVDELSLIFHKIGEVCDEYERKVSEMPVAAPKPVASQNALGITAAQAQSMSKEEIVAMAINQSSARANSIMGMLGPEDLMAMSKMNEQQIMEYLAKKGIDPEQLKAGADAASARGAAQSKSAEAKLRYAELAKKGFEIETKTEAIIEGAKASVRDLYNTKYRARIEAAEEKVQKLWEQCDEIGNGPIKEYNAACRQLYELQSEFDKQAHVMLKDGVLSALQYIKTDQLKYARDLVAASKAAMAPLPDNYDLEVGLEYLRKAKELEYLLYHEHEWLDE